MKSLTPLLLGVLCVMPLASAAEAPSGIHVSGAGELQVVPDMARVSLEARREGEDAAALKEDLDAATAAVLELARELDILDRDVTAANVNIRPRYRTVNNESRIDGLIATRSIEVTVRDLEQVGTLINGALERGVNGVQGVGLDASNRVELEREALNLAIDDATREARQIADRFGVELGKLVDASSSQHQVRPMMMEAAMDMRSSAKQAFAPGEMTIRREVQATFGIGKVRRGG